MTVRTFDEAIDLAVETAMGSDERVVVFGEDVPLLRRRLALRFGPGRVRPTPVSESAFLGAAVGAALGGLRPVVEVMMVDFLMVAMSALVNEAAKVATFSGGRWRAPLVVRAACGGGYGDAGQHEQALWGMLAGVPGLIVVVPSTPADAAGLMLSAIAAEDPVVFLEHKLLSPSWLEPLGGTRREGVAFDVPPDGTRGEVPDPPTPVPIGRAAVRREGGDLTILSLGVGVHRALAAADRLAGEGIEIGVVDLRTVAPLDTEAVRGAAEATGRILVVDEDYAGFGLSGEVAATIAEAGIPHRFGRVAATGTIPYATDMERRVLPSEARIVEAARFLVGAA